MKTEKIPKLDVTKYVGTDVNIVSATVENSKFGPVIKCVSNPIQLKDGDELPDDKQLIASILLGLYTSKKTGNLIVGSETKTEKFLHSKGLTAESLPEIVKVGDTIKELEGIKCKAQKKGDFLELC